MLSDEIEVVLRQMGATWRQEITADQGMAWAATLVQLDYGPTIDALEVLRETEPFLPSHSTLVQAVIRERNRDRPLGGCADCEGNGMKPGPVTLDGIATVVRCQCSERPESSGDHAKSCTCMDCHHGPRRAAVIRAGQDIAGRRSPADTAAFNSGMTAVRDDLQRIPTPPTPKKGGVDAPTDEESRADLA